MEKIDELKEESIDNLNSKERIIKLKLEEDKKKVTDNFEKILGLAFSNLSNIEEKEWNKCRKEYMKAKKYLLPNENVETGCLII